MAAGLDRLAPCGWKYSLRTEEDRGSLEAGGTGGCQHPIWVLRIELGSLSMMQVLLTPEPHVQSPGALFLIGDNICIQRIKQELLHLSGS